MLNILLSSFIGSMILISNAYIFNYVIFKKKINEFDIYKDTLFGFVLIGFIGLLTNFFFPINKIISSIFLIFSVFCFIYFFFLFKKKKNLLLILTYLTIVTFIMVTFANINRPDAGLYHLPFIKILNENKLIIGLTNLHYRFGHTSIFQYISGLHVNFFLKEEFLNIPLAVLPGLYFLYLFKNFFDELKRKHEANITALFLITIFSLYSFNRFSGLGNDGPANIFFFFLVVEFLSIQNIKNINNDKFYRITIISLFLIMLKPLMLFSLILPLLIFLINKNKFELLKDKKCILSLIFIFLWLLKNLFLSSCLIFPIKQTCFKNLEHSNVEIINIASGEAEAWAKGYPDSKIKTSFENYNSNFNWVKTWSQNHMKKVIEKIFPLIILLILLNLLFFKKDHYKDFNMQNKLDNRKLLYLIYFLFFYLFLWFTKFPVYRFGESIIASFIIVTFVFIINKKNKLKNEKILPYFLIFVFVIVCSKNITRIIKRLDQNYFNAPWPAMYSMKDNENRKKNFIKVYDKKKNFIYYYSGGEECMYTSSPCSNYKINDLIKKNTFGYVIFHKANINQKNGT